MTINIDSYSEREQQLILQMLQYFDETHEELKQAKRI